MKALWDRCLALLMRYREAISYLFFGGLATLLNIVLYQVFVNMMGMPVAAGNLLDTVLCILFAYVTNRLWVFGSKTTGSAALKEFMQFIACRIVTAVIDEVMMVVGVDWVGPMLVGPEHLKLWGVGMKVAANVIVIVLNYIFSKLIIFKKKAE